MKYLLVRTSSPKPLHQRICRDNDSFEKIDEPTRPAQTTNHVIFDDVLLRTQEPEGDSWYGDRVANKRDDCGEKHRLLNVAAARVLQQPCHVARSVWGRRRQAVENVERHSRQIEVQDSEHHYDARN